MMSGLMGKLSGVRGVAAGSTALRPEDDDPTKVKKQGALAGATVGGGPDYGQISPGQAQRMLVAAKEMGMAAPAIGSDGVGSAMVRLAAQHGGSVRPGLTALGRTTDGPGVPVAGASDAAVVAPSLPGSGTGGGSPMIGVTSLGALMQSANAQPASHPGMFDPSIRQFPPDVIDAANQPGASFESLRGKLSLGDIVRLQQLMQGGL